MTDPDAPGGSAADRRFREELRRSLAALEREQGDLAAEAERDEPTVGRERRPDRPAAGPVKAPRARSELFMDWAPLGAFVLALAALVGIAIYGIAGGDLGDW